MTGGVDEEKRRTLRRFATLGAVGSVAGLAERAQATDEESPLSREAIAGYIATTPGAHFSKLRDDLHLGTGEAQHHLRELEAAGKIVSHRDGDYRRFFPAGRFSEVERVALGYLRRETPRGIVLALLRDPSVTGAEIAERLEVSAATISGAAADLEAAGLLTRDDGYRLVEPATLLVLVIRYADTLGPEAVELADRAEQLIDYVGE